MAILMKRLLGHLLGGPEEAVLEVPQVRKVKGSSPKGTLKERGLFPQRKLFLYQLPNLNQNYNLGTKVLKKHNQTRRFTIVKLLNRCLTLQQYQNLQVLKLRKVKERHSYL